MSGSGAVSSVFRKGIFREKVAIVTGGATGIGNAITKELLYLGSRVVIASRKWDRLQVAERELNAQFGTDDDHPAYAVLCNIRKEDEVKNLMQKTLERFGKIDFVINNGGGQFPSPAANISLKGWNAVVETNLTGTFLMCREAYGAWMEDHGGAVVNIIANMFGGCPTMAHSGAARSGVDNLTKSLSIEWAQNGIRVNAVAPGSSIFSDTAAANYADPKWFQQTVHTIPARRLGRTEEVSGAVSFLLSPAASFITGVTMRVDGGASLYAQSFWTVPDHDKMPAYTWEKDVEEERKAEKDSIKSKL